MSELFNKYDVQVPRYTSYPTVPYWETTPTRKEWIDHIKATIQKDDATWSMYLHIPYCESLCTFCGCNNIITKDHGREKPYVDLLLKEWQNYLNEVPDLRKKKLKALHLGGGSPTFLSPENLTYLVGSLLETCLVDLNDFEGAIEIDPRRANKEQLAALRKFGFNRVSLGVQDFDPEVQRLVNRIQPYEMTESILTAARELGYTSINMDLIYGMAKQTIQSMTASIEKTLQLRPDRIALYSLAVVPWIKPQQRLFKDEDLPKKEEKRELYEIARKMLLENNYVEIGMDHFAQAQDGLALAQQKGKLHRNFMGYTDMRTDLLLGLGVSSISESAYSFYQNEKIFPVYEQQISKTGQAGHRGHILTDEDSKRRKQILELMTKGSVYFESSEQLSEAKEYLSEMLSDGLIQFGENSLSMTEKGKPFLRNACVYFDERLKRKIPSTRVFSGSI